MIAVDTDLLAYAHRHESRHHDTAASIKQATAGFELSESRGDGVVKVGLVL